LFATLVTIGPLVRSGSRVTAKDSTEYGLA
jgi:hypothetical protein